MLTMMDVQKHQYNTEELVGVMNQELLRKYRYIAIEKDEIQKSNIK